MNHLHLPLALALAGLSCACSTITGSENQNVSVQTVNQSGKEIAGASCELTNSKGKWFVQTPGSTMIHRSNDDMQVICNKEDLDAGRAAVVSDTKGSMFGNIIFGGGIGAIIDHSKGTAYEYPSFIKIMMGGNLRIENNKPTSEISTDPLIQNSTDRPAEVAPTSRASTANPG